MSFQGVANQIIGTAQGVASKVNSYEQGKAKEIEKQARLQKRSRKTADFKNYNNITANKSAVSLKNEIEGKKQQNKRISNRIARVKKKFDPSEAIHRDID